MNEASSKFVDKIATEKLLSEKLHRVHHQPDSRWQKIDTGLADISKIQGSITELTEESRNGHLMTSFSSLVKTGYEQNDVVRIEQSPAQSAVGDVIFVHGLYEDNREIYNFLISQLVEKNLNVHVLTLPYHYERQPASSAFSGEYYFSGDAYRNTVAFKQAVFDVTTYYQHVKQQSDRPVWLAGFSMGGGVNLTIAGLLSVDGIFVINPVCNIAHLIWNSTLFDPVKQDLIRAGFDQQSIADLYGEFEPLGFESPKTQQDRVVLGVGLYDQINDPTNYELLQQKWQLDNFITYKAGHLNILRVPKLAQDIRFFIGKNR